MSEPAPIPKEVYDARLALQEIITCQVVIKDMNARNELIAEGVEAHGMHLVRSAVGFINANAVTDVHELVAEDRFHYILHRLGGLCEFLARVDEVEELEIIQALSEIDFEYEGQDDEAKVVHAIRAAQTCLIAHHFVRRGSRPWGIQQTLRLDDMAAVVEMIGHLIDVVVDWFDEDHCGDLIDLLLRDVEMILRAQAHASGWTVSDQVRHYFAQVMSGTICE